MDRKWLKALSILGSNESISSSWSLEAKGSGSSMTMGWGGSAANTCWTRASAWAWALTREVVRSVAEAEWRSCRWVCEVWAGGVDGIQCMVGVRPERQYAH